jgi:photosystem II stability/assembly factor-like uncharacterized protein
MEREDDDPLVRIERLNQYLGIVNPYSFQRHLDNAIKDAATAGRADTFAARPWIPMGPRNIGGRIGALAQDPINPSILYAGSGFGGVWKTTDAGDTWTPLDNFSPPVGVRQALPVGAIAVARSNPQIVYVGTGEPTLASNGNDFDVAGFGLYRSVNGGAAFTQIDDIDLGTIKASRFERILVDPWDADRCWIACLKGLWRREAGGALTQDPITGGAPPAATQNVTDIVIDFGDVTAGAPATFTVYAGVYGSGIYSATFTRATKTYSAWTKLSNGLDESGFAKVKLTLCTSQPNILYSVVGKSDMSASNVYHSEDRGATWKKTGNRPDDSGKQANYDLFVAVHPKRPEVVFTGSVEVWRTQNSGDKWEKVLDWTNYDGGDRAQHADQHAFLFDGGRDGTVWLCNDGGISRSRNLGTTWRKKSYGILAVMFYDVTVHPTYPWVTAGGFQDNGCWVGFGGPTWYHLSGGDGGAVVFNPGDLTRMITTWQGWTGSGSRHQLGVVQCDISNVDETPGLHPNAQYKSALPDLTTVRPGDPVTIKKFKSDNSNLTSGFDGPNTATFTGVMEHHPTTANHFLVGRVGALYLTTDGSHFVKQNTGAFLGGGGNGPEVSAVAYAPSAPNTDWWMTTNQGEVFMTANAGTVWTDVTPPALKSMLTALPPGTFVGQSCTDVAIHPSNPSIAVVTVAMFAGSPGGQIYITGDKGVTWREISGRVAPVNAPALDQASPSAAMCVCFDPTVPAVLPAGPHTLYVGTLAGVFVIRNAVAPTAAVPAVPAPVWRTFNNNLPLTLVYDIVPVVVRNAANAVVRSAIRCGTHGRGLWECDLGGTPNVQLFIRDTPISDGRFYQGAAGLANDPRLVPAPPLRFDLAYDVRVAKPPFPEFEGRIDGAEFDELLINTVPVAGVKNQVFVQVHTNGSVDNLVDVRVQLYFANAPGTPPAVPDLQAAFWNSFPADPPAGAWRRGPFEFISGLGPAQPVVARLEWIPPLDVGNQVALLAVCSHAQDNLATPPLPALAMNPTNASSLVRTERRTAMRVTAVDFSFPSLYVRDGVNDTGPAGSVAWGGRSPDIIVRPAVDPTPDVSFADLGAARADDVVIGNATNQIYVRVSNRTDLQLSADVELYAAPHDSLDKPATWTQVGGTVNVPGIPGKGAKLSAPFAMPNPPDPTPGADYKIIMLIAIVYPHGGASPARNSITDLETLWKFLIEGINADMSAACRALPWKATP